MNEKPTETFDQENQPKERESGANYSEGFKKFVKLGVGETENGAGHLASDEKAIENTRRKLVVETKPNPVRPTEKILADQYHQEIIEGSEARNSRPEKKRHFGAKVMAGLAAFAGILGIVKVASDRQEEVDKIKDTENADRQRAMDRNRMSQQIEYDDQGSIKGVETSDGTQYEIKE